MSPRPAPPAVCRWRRSDGRREEWPRSRRARHSAHQSRHRCRSKPRDNQSDRSSVTEGSRWRRLPEPLAWMKGDTPSPETRNACPRVAGRTRRAAGRQPRASGHGTSQRKPAGMRRRSAGPSTSDCCRPNSPRTSVSSVAKSMVPQPEHFLRVTPASSSWQIVVSAFRKAAPLTECFVRRLHEGTSERQLFRTSLARRSTNRSQRESSTSPQARFFGEPNRHCRCAGAGDVRPDK